jgi:hypothetical protein
MSRATSARVRAILSVVVAAAASTPGAWAIKDKDNQGRWTNPTVHDAPDREVPGFLVNLGPTGARAVLTDKTFIVRYLFKECPASGRLELGDVITGAFGKPFSAHTFGGGPHGYEGPIMDLGNAIERAEGKDGKLVLNVTRGGKSIDVTIDLEPVGSFSATFPLQCRKSELLRARALKYFVDHPDATSGGASHTRMAVALALLASDDAAHQALAKKLIVRWSGEPPNGGTWSWDLSHQLITLSEYHIMTKDAAVLPTMKLIVGLLEKSQWTAPIPRWKNEEGVSYGATLDQHKNLYDGGFGHCPSPEVVSRGGGGYGPMQYTTLLAVIGWQLASRCGAEPGPDRIKRSLEFNHRCTNAAGAVGYGGEFTIVGAGLENMVDSAAWKKSTGGDNYVGRVGAALIAHKLSPEFPDSAEYIDKFKGYIKKAYKSLPDGHADSNLGILWGLMGAAASEDEAVLRTVLDYHKAWFNMMRCHDGSFVLLPGRDYADDGYYMASRYHPTGSMVLMLGLGNPKLMIQGTQVSIPGVNSKALRGTLASAYKSIVAKAYGDAARAVKAAGPEDAAVAASISEYLERQARRVLDPMGALDKAGRWVQMKDRIDKERKAHAGIASFDDTVRAWEVSMQGKIGSAIQAADRAIVDGQYGRAQSALQPALAATEDARLASIAQAVADRIAAAAKETVARWSALETSGEWYALRKELDAQAERWRGVAVVEDKAKALDATLRSEPGRALVEGHRLLLDDAFGPALVAMAPALADIAPAGTSSAARSLQARVRAASEKSMGALEAIEKEGRWQSLRDGIAKAKPKMAGLKAFEERCKAWEEGFATPAGRALVASDQWALQGNLAAAQNALEPALAAQDARAAAAKKRIVDSVMALLAPLAELEAKGDWYALERGLSALRRKLAGIPAFDEKDAAWQAAFKADPAKTAIRQGAVFQQLREAAARGPSKPLAKEVEAFAQQAGDTFYGRAAKDLLKTLVK